MGGSQITITWHKSKARHYSLDWIESLWGQSNWCHLFALSIWSGNSHHFVGSHYCRNYSRGHIKTWDINKFVRYESYESVSALELLYFVISPWPTDGPKCSSNKSVQRLSNLFFSLTRSLYFPAPFWLQLILRKCLQKRKPPTTTNFLQNMNNITSDVRLLWLCCISALSSNWEAIISHWQLRTFGDGSALRCGICEFAPCNATASQPSGKGNQLNPIDFRKCLNREYCHDDWTGKRPKVNSSSSTKNEYNKDFGNPINRRRNKKCKRASLFKKIQLRHHYSPCATVIRLMDFRRQNGYKQFCCENCQNRCHMC